MRRGEMSWHELRRAEKNGEERRKNKEELKLDEMGWVEERWEKLRWHEKSWGEKTWDEMRWGVKSWEDTRWDEMRWDGMTRALVTMGCSEQFPREAAMRWDQVKGKIPPWQEMAPEWKSRDCCCEAQMACPHPKAHSLFRSIGCRCFNFETPAPGLPGTTCIGIRPSSQEDFILGCISWKVTSVCMWARQHVRNLTHHLAGGLRIVCQGKFLGVEGRHCIDAQLLFGFA